MSISSNIRAGVAYVEVTAETSTLQRNLTQAQAQLQSFGRACTNVGKDLLMVSAAMAMPLVMAAKSFAGFDDRMRLVQAVTQATEADFKALTKTAQRLGRDTSYTAQQAADAMVSLGRMGFNPKEIQTSIDAVLNLARSTGTELADAGDIAANSMRIFGIEAAKMSDVADVLTVTANSSAQTLIDLFEGLKMGGPQAAAAGESIRETCASLAVLANMGIKGSLAGTALRKSFSQFSKVKVQDQLKALGVETVDANGNLRKMADVMRDVSRVMNSMPSAEKLAFAEDIFDIRGSLAGLTLGANTKDLDAMLEKLQDVEGVSAKTAAAMDAGLGGAFRLLESAVEGSLNAITDAMNGTLQPLIVKITTVINEITKWVEANAGMVTSFAVVIAGAAGLGVALIAIGVAAKGAAAGITVIQTSLKVLSLVQGLCVAKGTTLGTSLSLLTQSFINYRNAAIPAMVGTSQLLAALNLPLDVRSKHIAAGLVLMSNAEAAAAAKSQLAIKWNAACAALKNFSFATIAATSATKAQAVAESASALGVKILAGARTFAATATGLFSLANIKAAATATAGGAANLFLALTTKAVAGGYMIASAAVAAFCAIPMVWILIATGAALAGLVVWLSRAGKYTAQLSDKMGELCRQGDQLRQTDKLRMERLRQLSEKQKLTNAEMAEAKKLARDLQQKYGDLGITITDNAMRIAALSSVASRLGALEFTVTDADDLEKIRQLKAFSLKVNLDADERSRAVEVVEALSEKYGNLGVAVDQAGGRIVSLNAAAERIDRVQIDVADSDGLARLEHLKNLSYRATLTVEEQDGAEMLIAELSGQYGDLGVTVDRVSGKIIRLNTVAANLREFAFRIKGPEDAEKLARIQELADIPMLDISGMTEANILIDQLKDKYGDLGVMVDATGGRIVAMTEAQRQFASVMQSIQAGEDPLKETHLVQLERLKKLAEQERLTAAEQTEAQNIVNALNEAYGGLGLGIDTITGKLDMASDAQQKLNDKMKQATLAELDAEIAEMEANLKELQSEDEALLSYWNHNLWSRITGRQEEALKKLEANGDRALAYRQKINAAGKRKQAINEGDESAVLGEAGVTTGDTVEIENQRRLANDGAAADAADKVAEIDKKLAQERKTELENEIDDIIALRDEYKSLIQTMLDYEKNKPEKQQDKGKIGELEGKLAEADKTADERIAKVREKAAEPMKREVADLQRRFEEYEQDIRNRRTEAERDRQIDATRKEDPNAGVEMLQRMIEEYRATAQAAKAQFYQELEAAQADKTIDDDEHVRLSELQSGYSRAESMLDKYEDKIRDAQDGTRKAAENLKPQGAFLAAALDGVLGGSTADRTAKATEMIAVNTKKTNDYLRRSGGNVTFV